MKISFSLLSFFILNCKNQENTDTLINKNELEDEKGIFSSICNIVSTIYEYMSKIEEVLEKLCTTKKEINLYFDKISEKGTYSFPNIMREVVLRLYDIIYNPKVITENKLDENNKIDISLPSDTVLFYSWNLMCKEVMKGNFLGVPDNIMLENAFINYLITNCNNITAEEYNNISRFLHIAKDRKEYEYNSRLESIIPKHTFLFGTKKGLVDVLTDISVIVFNNQEQVCKTVKECLNEIEKQFEEEDNSQVQEKEDNSQVQEKEEDNSQVQEKEDDKENNL